MLTVDQVEEVIAIPVDEWKGRCHEVAALLLRHHLVEGTLCYGHYVGTVAPDGYFPSNLIFQRHGWIEDVKGNIIDPTRWVFENVKPYIYEGPNDAYDFGGNALRAEQEELPPLYDDSEAAQDLDFNPDLIAIFFHDSDQPWDKISITQAMWLANLSLITLREDAYSVFKELDRLGQRAFIPLDNRLRVLGR